MASAVFYFKTTSFFVLIKLAHIFAQPISISYSKEIKTLTYKLLTLLEGNKDTYVWTLSNIH